MPLIKDLDTVSSTPAPKDSMNTNKQKISREDGINNLPAHQSLFSENEVCLVEALAGDLIIAFAADMKSLDLNTIGGPEQILQPCFQAVSQCHLHPNDDTDLQMIISGEPSHKEAPSGHPWIVMAAALVVEEARMNGNQRLVQSALLHLDKTCVSPKSVENFVLHVLDQAYGALKWYGEDVAFDEDSDEEGSVVNDATDED